VNWIRYDIEKLLFGQSAALMVLQGWPLMKFFEGVSFSSPMIDTVFDGALKGDFVFLRGELSDLASPPLTLSKIVLGRITKLKEGLTRDEVLGALVAEVFPPRFP
jgi:hypothetical protein